jgi:predicted Zn finger-like uncharacterized protein
MKFLCPNCKAKYRIGSEKLVGRQAAKIRCRKCDYRIQIAPRPGSDEYDVTASPNSIVPSAAPPRALKVPPPGPPGGVLGGIAARPRMSAVKDEPTAVRKPTAAIPGLPGLGSPKSTRGAVLHAEGLAGSSVSALRRPVTPPPPAPLGAPFGAGALPPLAPPPTGPAFGGGLAAQAFTQAATPVPARPLAGTQLADQFRQSVQAGGAATEELPQDGWFVGVNGVPLGPIPVGDLRELAVAGHIDRRSLVWREGLAEWRPLGKFPQLARVLDEGSVAPSGAFEPEIPPAPAPNGSNGHVAIGFTSPRSPEGEPERPSAWGDLDDEDDDDDEQPTTIKGRVSVPPPASVMPSNTPPSLAPPAPSAPAPVSFGAPLYGAPPQAQPLNRGQIYQPSAPPVTPEGGPTSTISATPEPIVDDSDAKLMRPRGKRKIYTWLIVAAAFILGGIITRMVSGGGEPPTPPAPEPARALSPSVEAKPEPVRPNPHPPEQVPGPAPEEGDGEIGTQGQTSVVYPVSKPGLGGSGLPTPPAAVASGPKQTTALLSSLSGLPTAGPMAGARVGGDGPAPGVSLDATAIQRTVRRYSPAVRQNCWQRALNARAPGIPSSAKVTALITIEPSGRVQSVTVSGAPRGYPGLAACIEGSVKGWAFPRAGGETVTNVPFMFVGQ